MLPQDLHSRASLQLVVKDPFTLLLQPRLWWTDAVADAANPLAVARK